LWLVVIGAFFVIPAKAGTVTAHGCQLTVNGLTNMNERKRESSLLKKPAPQDQSTLGFALSCLFRVFQPVILDKLVLVKTGIGSGMTGWLKCYFERSKKSNLNHCIVIYEKKRYIWKQVS
jgi:hypothetical protein